MSLQPILNNLALAVHNFASAKNGFPYLDEEVVTAGGATAFTGCHAQCSDFRFARSKG